MGLLAGQNVPSHCGMQMGSGELVAPDRMQLLVARLVGPIPSRRFASPLRCLFFVACLINQSVYMVCSIFKF